MKALFLWMEGFWEEMVFYLLDAGMYIIYIEFYYFFIGDKHKMIEIRVYLEPQYFQFKIFKIWNEIFSIPRHVIVVPQHTLSIGTNNRDKSFLVIWFA